MNCKRLHRKNSASMNRWLEFVNNVAGGIQLGIDLFIVDGRSIQAPEACPRCCKPNHIDLSAYQELFVSGNTESGMVRFNLQDDSPALYAAINEMVHVIVHRCTCMEIADETFYERATVVCELLASFHQEGIRAEHGAVELSMLRHMNRIILSLFQGSNNALEKAFELLLSSAVILLDADAGWLDINIDGSLHHYTKGEKDLSQITDDQEDAIAADVPSGDPLGQIAVMNPADRKDAQRLMPLLAQECSIVLKLHDLFNLAKLQASTWLGAIGSSFLLIDQHFSIIYVNRTAEEFWEELSIELLGRNISVLSGPWEKHIVSRSKEIITEQMEMIKVGNNTFWVDWQLSPLLEEGEPAGWVLLVNDRTDFYRWHEASMRAERFASTAALVGSLAHELRNPLSAASGLLQILNKKQGPGKAAEFSDLILRELERMSKLLNEFLLMGKPANISFEPVDLISLVYELAPLVEGEASGYGHEIIIDHDYETCLVWGDPGQLTQVILNLARNAVEAMETPGQVTLSIEKDDKKVCLYVRDHGPGIKAEVMDKLFKPFFSTKERGTGLGLSVVKAIINNHGGQISCCNIPDGGAEFRIQLVPYQISEVTEAIKIDLVLISKNRVIENALRNAGLKLIVIHHPQETKSLLNRYEPGVIVTEYPHKEGTADPCEVWPDTPVICIGQHCTKDIKVEPIDHSPMDYIKLIAKIENSIRPNH